MAMFRHAHEKALLPEESLPVDSQTLVGRIRAGDAVAFDQLVVAHFNAMARYAAVVLGTADAAEDVVQDVFVRLWRTRSTWVVNTALRSYLLAAVRHEALNRLRHERGRARVSDRFALTAVSVVSDEADALAMRADLVVAINALPPRRREAILLRFVEGLSFPQVADILGISTKAAEQLVMRTMQTLRAQYPR